MADITQETILEALKSVVDPDTGRNIVEAGMVTGLVVKGGNVGFALEVAASDGAAKEPLRKAAEDALRAVSGVLSATVVLTAERPQ